MAIAWPNWCRLSLEPDDVVGAHEMLRWYIFKSRRFAIYVHKHTGDDPRQPHDHPADNLSIRLKGEVFEYRPADMRRAIGIAKLHGTGPIRDVSHGTRLVWYTAIGSACEVGRRMPRFTFRKAEDVHRLEASAIGPCWSIWIRGRYRRPWGYFEFKGWRPARTKHQPGPGHTETVTDV